MKASHLAVIGLTVLGGFLVAADEKPASAPPLAKPDQATLAAFEQFKQLDGAWEGKSTKGWTEKANYRTMAKGSCVLETSMEAHPNETMATVYHLDGPHLMLTHYCMAQNQPRMRATEVSADGKTVTFTFLDGTNMATRDQGHMDKVLFKFIDNDHFTSKWTWYEKGQERWMEEIVYTRVKEATAKQP